MHKFMKIVGYILALIGLACVVKYIMHCKECCCLCGWHKTKVEEEKPTDSTVSHKTKVEEEKPAGSTVSHKIKVEEEKPAGSTVSHKIKVEDEKQQGSRYGSNPIRY